MISPERVLALNLTLNSNGRIKRYQTKINRATADNVPITFFMLPDEFINLRLPVVYCYNQIFAVFEMNNV